MSNRFQGRTPRFDLIDDLIDSTAIIHQRKPPSSNRTYSNYSSLPISLNKTDQSSSSTKLPDRLHLPFARSDSSSIMSNNDERRKELDLLLKHLYDGKLISTINGSHSDAITTTANKQEKENSTNLEVRTIEYPEVMKFKVDSSLEAKQFSHGELLTHFLHAMLFRHSHLMVI